MQSHPMAKAPHRSWLPSVLSVPSVVNALDPNPKASKGSKSEEFFPRSTRRDAEGFTWPEGPRAEGTRQARRGLVVAGRRTILGMIPRRQNDWEHGPVYYRRRFRFIVAMLGVVGLVGVLLSQSTHLVGPSYRWWMPAASFVSMVVGMVAIALAISRFRRRIRREFEAAEGRLCTHCGYNLRDLPPRGGCPECGHEFDAEFDARTWAGAGFVVPRPLEPPSPDA